MKEIKVSTEDGEDVAVEYDFSELANAVGFEGEKAAELNARLRLVADIRSAIANRKMTQTEVAALLGIHQSRVSVALRGAARGVTIDALIQYAGSLGLDVHVTTSPAARPVVVSAARVAGKKTKKSSQRKSEKKGVRKTRVTS